MAGMEWHLAEQPTIECLNGMGYAFVSPADHPSLRDGDNQVLFRPHLIAALQRINGVSEADAQAAYAELASVSGNEAWLSILRGNFSRVVQGEATHRTLRVIDFLNPQNNLFTVTHQFRVKAEKTRVADMVIHVNGIPLVVIECKSPINAKDKTGEAFEQIKQYEQDIPRLFLSNGFNIVTDGTNCLYGSTGSPSKFWAEWRDPWPKAESDFPDALSKGLWSLLEPSRLLDLIAHFIVFEKTESGTIKKMCRYQQFRAVNKIVERVIGNEHRRGLIWHTQGSGKSLTMVFAALKLKTHLTVASPELTNPNIMVLTDRVDLHDQISGTFAACGLPNPVAVESISELRALIGKGTDGLTILSTIFKFQGSQEPIPNSKNWIVMVDECHRTQEKDLGAYLRKTMPEARFFGFTGTPIKKNDKDTYANFGVVGEGYLDKYGIDDAVADGATVPIYYTGRKTDWHIDEAKIDILFDNWFADLPEGKLAEVKKRGVKITDLVKHPKRIDLIAYDLWTHFKAYARPDGFKAQIVAIDREAVILYKQALDRVIAEDLIAQGIPAEEAKAQAAALSACVYSESQEDGKPSEDGHIQSIRADLKAQYLDQKAETAIKKAFSANGQNPEFLIVCDKLLTGFDAPIESVMYLDKPLKEHGLLQAIARTNRVANAQKKNGLIVDYIGVSAKLEEALSSYRADDVKNAMQDLDDLRNQLRAAHAGVMAVMKGLKRQSGPSKDGLKAEFDQFANLLKTEDKWFEFRSKAREFIGLYEAVSPDPSVLEFTADLKWVAAFLQYGTQVFEKREAFDQQTYSRKIRDMLAQHLDATGLSVTVKLRHITDPEFWEDFETEGKTESDLKTAAIRKTTELRKVVTEKMAQNHHQYAKFSDRLRELLEKLDGAQLSWADKLKMAEEMAKDLDAEAKAHEGTGLSAEAYGILQVLKAFGAEGAAEDLAIRIEGLYTDDATAPPRWQEKDGLRRTLRQQVRGMAHEFGLKDLKAIPEHVEEFALKHFAKV
ncbi:type I restriction endonuclease subunit R [Microvirga sp. 17 mud 1-3]|uniref:type I restriction endonuclease subunit R n=1 Tax=Microvirga sp. 17 mud 1-3 TaxID=2082949 RepID=UPI000D6AAE26|nr:HsdR family type I site-specific deoxyribonuclease [Microvirga sp. 17 mud 1-3]AWM86795.1 restriction endonuclease subunit R [Microvirga sp. 17 mud 1-3]